MSLLVCVDAVLEKVEFDLLTPSPGSGEVGEGVGEGKDNSFSVMLGHPTLYWAS